jgi:hypothetical protein
VWKKADLNLPLIERVAIARIVISLPVFLCATIDKEVEKGCSGVGFGFG